MLNVTHYESVTQIRNVIAQTLGRVWEKLRHCFEPLNYAIWRREGGGGGGGHVQ